MGARRVISCAAAAILVAFPTAAHSQVARLRGRVFDSVAALPLPGAHVELVKADDRTHIFFSTTSDSLGRFILDSIARGNYIAGFMHPMLDSLGLGVAQRMLTVTSDGEVGLDLSVPGPERIQGALCGKSVDTTTNGAVLGYVLNSHTLAPAESATVIAEWSEYVLGKSGIAHTVLSRRARTDAEGWFAVCGVPKATSVVLRAITGSDTSGPIELDVPKTRIARRNLYVDHLPSTEELTTHTADGAFKATPHNATVSGWVRTEDGVPIPGAQVKVFDTDAVAVTNREGAFELAGVPGGTQTLITRAIGFLPDERPVDLTDRRIPVVVGLLSVRHFLDTVHVRAARPTLMSVVGFDDRRRGGTGRFFTVSEIERLHPQVLTDLLRHAPSLDLSTDNAHNVRIRMRGDQQPCTPAIFLDGKQLINWELADLNSLVDPDQIGGMEVYTASMTPVQFRSKQACGTILVWTKIPDRLMRPR